MNTPVEMPDGSLQDFSPAEARKAAAFLGAHLLPRCEESEQPGVLRAIRDFEFAGTPEIHFDVERFTPKWYVPGWVPNG